VEWTEYKEDEPESIIKGPGENVPSRRIKKFENSAEGKIFKYSCGLKGIHHLKLARDFLGKD